MAQPTTRYLHQLHLCHHVGFSCFTPEEEKRVCFPCHGLEEAGERTQTVAVSDKRRRIGLGPNPPPLGH